MVGTLLLVVIVALFAAIIGALIALKLARPLFNETSIDGQQKLWERAQEHSRSWETRQERRITELETHVTGIVTELKQTLQDQEVQNKRRILELVQQFETLERQTRVEQVLANLPRVEDTPIVTNGHVFPDWHPPILHDVDLSGRDLSYRYLRQADLRNARLVKTNFFMADLSGAYLSGANLREADLSGANLSGADLRDAILTGANLQVADLNKAILTETNLLDAHNLTTQQLYSAVYDSSTRLDDDVNVTARMPIVKAPKANKAVNVMHQAVASPTEALAISDVPTRNMPAVSALNGSLYTTEPEIAATSNGASPISPPETPLPIDEYSGDEPAFLSSLQISSPNGVEDFMETPEMRETLEMPASSTSANQEEALAVAAPEPAEPEAIQPVTDDVDYHSQPESSFPSLLPDLDLETLMRQQKHSLLLSQLSSGDSLLDPKVTDLLVDRPENSRTGELDRATPRRKRNGKRRAKAS
jgi:hypothetical protein